ncbi:hypothetical protein D3C87_2109500 [compost metagenome]
MVGVLSLKKWLTVTLSVVPLIASTNDPPDWVTVTSLALTPALKRSTLCLPATTSLS